MKKLLAVTALVAVIASPALAQSEMGIGAARPGILDYAGPLGPIADWSDIYIDNYGRSRSIRVPNSTHKPYGLW
jgi:hypothetical protein